jgi:hypothetical protein
VWRESHVTLQFDWNEDGNPSQLLIDAKQERLENWHILQELR